MSTAPSHPPTVTPPARPHLRLVSPVGERRSHGHRLHPRSRRVTAIDAAAVLAVLYAAVLMIRFLPF